MLIILDFGSQYTHLIVRHVRERGVQYKLYHVFDSRIECPLVQGIILSGGHDETMQTPFDLTKIECPILGICHGMHEIVRQFGGQLEINVHREYGETKLSINEQSQLFSHVPAESTVWMSHCIHASKLPPDFVEVSPTAAFQHKYKPIYGLQFHPEVTHTEYGKTILDNFLDICGCTLGTWDLMRDEITPAQDRIKKMVATDLVIGAVSGGVDSTVASKVVFDAIGEQYQPIFIDLGLMRIGEIKDVQETFDGLGINLIIVDYQNVLIERLAGVIDPEIKRRIVGDLYIEVLEMKAQELGAKFLVQGTLYPDVIESKRIKTHHNVGINTKLQLIEPFRFLFKDEVKRVGQKMGIPNSVLNRQPYPGPGLVIRILGQVTEERLRVLKHADLVFREAFQRSGLIASQTGVILLSDRATAVLGDCRGYGYVLAIRAVDTENYMTAVPARLPYEFLTQVATEIVNKVKEITRVVYDITSKPPATIEWC